MKDKKTELIGLTPDERSTIEYRMHRSPACPARALSERLWSGRVTAEERLDARLFCDQTLNDNFKCLEIYYFGRLWQDYRLRRHKDRRQREYMTIQKGNRKRWRTTMGKIYAYMTGWYRAVQRKIGKDSRFVRFP